MTNQKSVRLHGLGFKADFFLRREKGNISYCAFQDRGWRYAVVLFFSFFLYFLVTWPSPRADAFRFIFLRRNSIHFLNFCPDASNREDAARAAALTACLTSSAFLAENSSISFISSSSRNLRSSERVLRGGTMTPVTSSVCFVVDPP